MNAKTHAEIAKEAEELKAIVADTPSFFSYNLDEDISNYLKKIEESIERMKEIAYPNGYCPDCEGKGCYDCLT